MGFWPPFLFFIATVREKVVVDTVALGFLSFLLLFLAKGISWRMLTPGTNERDGAVTDPLHFFRIERERETT
jgi:hypothetical protein